MVVLGLFKRRDVVNMLNLLNYISNESCTVLLCWKHDRVLLWWCALLPLYLSCSVLNLVTIAATSCSSQHAQLLMHHLAFKHLMIHYCFMLLFPMLFSVFEFVFYWVPFQSQESNSDLVMFTSHSEASLKEEKTGFRLHPITFITSFILIW